MKPPGYRIELELLATISRAPIPLSSLCEEFGFSVQSEVREALDRLRNYRIHMLYQHEDGEMTVSVCPDSWPRAKAMAEKYMGEQMRHEVENQLVKP